MTAPDGEIRSYEFARQYTGCRASLHGAERIRSYEFPSLLAEVLISPLRDRRTPPAFCAIPYVVVSPVVF